MSRTFTSPRIDTLSSAAKTYRRSNIIRNGMRAVAAAAAAAATPPPPPPAHYRPPSGHDMLAAAQGFAQFYDTVHRNAFLDCVEQEYYKDENWFSEEYIKSMRSAAHCKALVLLSAPHSPQPCSPQHIGYTSTGEPIYSATIVPH